MIVLSLTACGVDTSSSGSTSSSIGTTTDTTTTTDTVVVVTSSGSVFSTVEAELDANACILNDTFQVIEDSSFDPNSAVDAANGIEITSQYPYSTNVDAATVALFYPSLQGGILEKTVHIYEENYRLSFDEAWYSNTLVNVYVRTPKDLNGTYSCYRYKLDSISGNTIVKTKVYR